MSAFTQLDLQGALERRIRASGYTRADVTHSRPEVDTLVCVVLRDFQLERYVLDTLAYLRSVPEPALAAWYRSFTKALFLVGDPRRVAARHALAHISSDGSSGRTLPASGELTLGLRRLLKPLRALPPALPERMSMACGPGQRALGLAVETRDLSLEGYLVHLTHTLAESYIEGHLQGVGRLCIRNQRELTSPPGRILYMRIQRDGQDDARLRLFGCTHLLEGTRP